MTSKLNPEYRKILQYIARVLKTKEFIYSVESASFKRFECDKRYYYYTSELYDYGSIIYERHICNIMMTDEYEISVFQAQTLKDKGLHGDVDWISNGTSNSVVFDIREPNSIEDLIEFCVRWKEIAEKYYESHTKCRRLD